MDTLPDGLTPYKKKLTPRFHDVLGRVQGFLTEVVIPKTPAFEEQCDKSKMLADLQSEAKKRGIWNLFLPEVSRLTTLEYTHIAEIIGSSPIASLAMNCNAPDTNIANVLLKHGSHDQKQSWLIPLLAGEISSALAVTEPGVASSDLNNLATNLEAFSDEYILNGHKWYVFGATRSDCKILVVLGKTNLHGSADNQHGALLVPTNMPGVKILRAMESFHATIDAAEIIFENVRVPKENLLLGEGCGLEIMETYSGVNPIYQSMRSIALTEMAVASIVDRAQRRKSFGKVFIENQTVKAILAEARLEIEQCRQLCYLAAQVVDMKGLKAAQSHIAMMNIAVPRMAQRIVDEAIQMHGGHGVCQDSKLAEIYVEVRTSRLLNGPEILLNVIAENEFRNAVTETGKKNCWLKSECEEVRQV